jgi:hypothetical protein
MSEEKQMTIDALRGLIFRNAVLLKDQKETIKRISEMQVSMLENDAPYSQAVLEAEEFLRRVKSAKKDVQKTPEAKSLDLKKKEAKDQEKGLKVVLSDHLTNYFALTGSKVFDLNDSLEIRFNVSSNFSAHQLDLFE